MTDQDKESTWSTGHEIEPAEEEEEDLEVTVTAYDDSAEGESIVDVDPTFTVTLFNPELHKPVPRNLKHGFLAQLPMQCHGTACPYFKVCDVYPQDMQDICVRERYYIENAMGMYMDNLKVGADDLVNMVGVKDLITIDLKIERINMWMKIHPGEDFVEQIMSYDRDGREAKRLEEHPSHILLDKLMNRREKLLEQMMGTKRARKKIVRGKRSGSQEAQRRRMKERQQRIAQGGTARRDQEK